MSNTTSAFDTSRQTSLPLESMVRMIAQSDHAIEGLQAMADEVGGRDGASIRSLAASITRGDTVQQLDADAPSLRSLPLSTILHASQLTSDSPGQRIPGIQLPRWMILQSQRTNTRKQLRRIVWFALVYGILTTLAGSYLLELGNLVESDLVFTYDFFGQDDGRQGLGEVLHSAYVASFYVLLVLVLLWIARSDVWLRLANRSTTVSSFCLWMESFWNGIPFVGATYRAIDLAEVSESIAVSLTSRWTFPDAFRWAAKQSASFQLRLWLSQSADAIERGESVTAALDQCPIPSPWLQSMSSLLSVESPQATLAEQWRLLSERMHVLMLRQRQRNAVVFFPLAVLVSIAILLFGWANMLSHILNFISAISGFM